MDEPVQTVRETTTQAGNTVQTTQEAYNPGAKAAHKQNVLANIIRYIAGILLAILAIRFVLVLLGANEANAFANLIFNLSSPFVAPFSSLFNSTIQYGASRLEVFTLVAMTVYALVAYGIERLATINRA